jgi:hypothetical protein
LGDVLTTIGEIGSIGTAVGTIALVLLFWKTMQQLEETVKLTKIQANYRFRPWIGHFSNVQHISTTPDGREQFSIAVKNYGEIPATNVIVKFITRKELPTKDILKIPEGMENFSLGPLLPNMEKRYWFFIDSDLIQKVKNDTGQVFILLYFSYDHHVGSSGYGLISHYDKASNSFIHDEMWID